MHAMQVHAPLILSDEVDGLYEAWMAHADAVLADDKIVMAAYAALAKRHRLSCTRVQWLFRRSGRAAVGAQART
jgi:hypothetical protein